MDGRQVQVAVMLGEEPEVLRLTQLLIFTPFALNKTVPATDTEAVIVTGDLNTGVVEKVIKLTEPINLPSITEADEALIAKCVIVNKRPATSLKDPPLFSRVFALMPTPSAS